MALPFPYPRSTLVAIQRRPLFLKAYDPFIPIRSHFTTFSDRAAQLLPPSSKELYSLKHAPSKSFHPARKVFLYLKQAVKLSIMDAFRIDFHTLPSKLRRISV
jgi:hypothetical protein